MSSSKQWSTNSPLSQTFLVSQKKKHALYLLESNHNGDMDTRCNLITQASVRIKGSSNFWNLAHYTVKMDNPFR